jgi:tetratricopeptide (TPR) repeat protein
MPKNFLKTICWLMFFAAFMASGAFAKVPDSIFKKKNAVVSLRVYDNDKRLIESGSGFIVDRDGVIVTNCSVVAKWIKEVENTLYVEMEGGVSIPIEELISNRCENNLALIRIKAKDLPAVKLSKDCYPRPGEKISVIKNLPESGAAVSKGIVRGINEKNRSFQISQRMVPASSGSPVFNAKGEVIGAVIVRLWKGKKLNFAVNIKNITGQLAKYIKSRKAVVSGVGMPEPPEEAVPVEKSPDDPLFYFSRGTGFDQSKMYREAIDAYEQSLKIDPDFADAYINLGVDYYELGKYEKAIDAFKQAIRIKPDLLPAYNKLGAAYIICGEYSKAVDTFKKILEIDPNNVPAHFNLGIAYFLKGDVFDAQEECLTLKNVDKKRSDNLFDLIN